MNPAKLAWGQTGNSENRQRKDSEKEIKHGHGPSLKLIIKNAEQGTYDVKIYDKVPSSEDETRTPK